MTTINKQVSLGTDDCHEFDGTTLTTTGLSLQIGHNLGMYDGGIRWQSVAVPNSASITSAKLSLYRVSGTGSIVTVIKGVDEDNTATWSSGDRPSGRSKTTANVSGDQADWNNWGTGVWIDISVTSIIQEIVNRGGWSTNNALALVIEDWGSGTDYMYVRSYEYSDHSYAPKLDITFVGRTTRNARQSVSVHAGVLFQTLTSGHGY